MAQIEELATECRKGIAELLAAAISEDSSVKGVLHGRDIQQMQERYDQWAGNLGALRHFKSALSLEHRLRDAPLVRESILKTLKDLNVSIQDATDITAGKRLNRTSDPSFNTNLSEYNVSSSESESSSVSSTTSGRNALVPTSEIQELVAAIKTGLDSLFKSSIFIRKYSAKDKRVKAAETKPFNNVADIMHITYRYPLLQQKNPALAARLGEANARRRQYFKYRRDHNERLSTVSNRHVSHDSGNLFKEQSEVIIQENKSKSAMTEDTKPSQFVETEATELLAGAAQQAQMLKVHEGPSAESTTSFVTSIAETSDERMPFPPVPSEAQTGSPFFCPYCQTFLKLKRQGLESQWKKHVLRDLEPYVCTFSSCSLDSFQSQYSWFEHELLAHRSRWYCSQCIIPFESSDLLARHISSHHHEVVSDRQLSAIINHSKRPVESIQPDECPFCPRLLEKVDSGSTLSEEPLAIDLDQFRRHLGRHLEEVALFALPRPNQDYDGSLVSNDGHPDQDGMSKSFRWVRDDCGRGWSIISRRRTTFIAIASFLALSRALSVLADIVYLIEISSKLLSYAVEYATQVKSAKEDIARFRVELEAFVKVLQSLHALAQNPEASKLVTFQSLTEYIQQCKLDLEHMQKKLDPSKGRKSMSQFGVQALKWPFEKKELHNAIDILERYKSTFSTALNAYQTSLILEAGVKLKLGPAEQERQDRLLSKLPYADGANFDSYERVNEPYCLPDTRVDLLSQIMDWSADPSHKTIFWLSGMAGTGKSTIARTIARTLTEQKRLTANFFFSRGRGDLSHAGKLFSTIAVQLATTSPPLKNYICKAIAEDTSLGQRNMRDQWTKLICQPISRLRSDSHSPQILVFIFDALDECGRPEDIRTLLRLLAETKLSVQLRVLITSRPEKPIRLGFYNIPGDMHEDFVLHNIAPRVIQHDIAAFLRHELSNIRDERLLPSDWPNKETFELLVKKSSGLFIYVATVCRFIRDPRWLPVQRLKIVLEENSEEQSPEQPLDEMYMQILESSVFGDCNEKERDLLSRQFRDTVGLIMVLFDPLPATVLKSLFPTLSETIDTTLEPLKSLLDVPHNQNAPIRLFHPSFRDFLLNQERCRAKHFWIDQKKSHLNVAEQCLHLMSKALKRNICLLLILDTPRREIESTVLDRLLPSQLRYACQYWIYHIREGLLSDHIIRQIYVFLQTHFLHWLEALSLMGKISQAFLLMDMLKSVVTFQANADLVLFVDDGKRFILKSRYMVDIVPLRLYSSALISSPNASLIKRVFFDQMPKGVESWETWKSSLNLLDGHSSSINAVAFSPYGQQLASTSSDDTVRLWDPTTGDLRSTLEGHSSRVFSLVFSPDGQLLASGSNDNTVSLWDSNTGECRSVLEGHFSRVHVVAFSPDGQLLASASSDRTVRLWNPITGECRSVLEGHSDWVHVVAFSPDGQLLASASGDQTVRLWDPITGECRSVLEGHSSWVDVVAFSPDGQLLASGSGDQTVRLWNPITGECRSVLEGHSDWVHVVAFSPDGQPLASASSDNTVRLWDPATGKTRGTLEGHSSQINTLEFSPDVQILASGSEDNTVRLWNPITGDLQSMLEDHSDGVNVVAFSPDGQFLASGSSDGTVRLWDPTTGRLRGIYSKESKSG